MMKKSKGGGDSTEPSTQVHKVYTLGLFSAKAFFAKTVLGFSYKQTAQVWQLLVCCYFAFFVGILAEFNEASGVMLAQ